MKLVEDHVDSLTAQWGQIHSDVDIRSYPVLLRAVRAGRLIEETFERVARNHGLAVRGDYDVLAALRRSLPEPLKPSQLAEVSLVSNSGMTGRLDRLENLGLLRRVPHPGDRRALNIEITDEGVELVDRAFSEMVRVSSELLGDDLAEPLEGPLRFLLVALGDLSRRD